MIQGGTDGEEPLPTSLQEGVPRPVEEGGALAYYGLTAWWTEALTPEEQESVEKRFHPMGSSRTRPLSTGSVLWIGGDTGTPASLVAALIGWMRSTPEDEIIRRKLVDKLEELVAAEPNVIAKHFALQKLLQEHYRRRGEPGRLQAAEAACREAIQIAPAMAEEFCRERDGPLPRHVGYQILAKILFERRGYKEALRVCEEARAAGWGRDWGTLIRRYRLAMRHEGAGEK